MPFTHNTSAATAAEAEAEVAAARAGPEQGVPPAVALRLAAGRNPPACTPTLSPAASAACSLRDRFSGRTGRRAASAPEEEPTATKPGTAAGTADGAVEASTMGVPPAVAVAVGLAAVTWPTITQCSTLSPLCTHAAQRLATLACRLLLASAGDLGRDSGSSGGGGGGIDSSPPVAPTQEPPPCLFISSKGAGRADDGMGGEARRDLEYRVGAVGSAVDDDCRRWACMTRLHTHAADSGGLGVNNVFF